MKLSILTLILTICFGSHLSFGQVTNVEYKLDYGDEPNTFNFYLIIDEGQASSIIERTQFNAQISLVTNSGTELSIKDTYMPLRNNQFYEGKSAQKWSVTSVLRSPMTTPDFDFYSIVPSLAPAAQYNDIVAGDEILLFTVLATRQDSEEIVVRLYENSTDRESQKFEKHGGDFTNGFTLGGVKQIYGGNTPTADRVK